MEDRKHARFDGIELVRFLLSFSVIIAHYYFFGPLIGVIAGTPLPSGMKYILFTLEIFFAISGFVIVMSTRRRTSVDFAISRYSRIAPTLLVASTITLLMYYGLGSEPRLHHVFRHYIGSITVLPLAASDGLDWSLWTLKADVRFYFAIFICMKFFDVAEHALKLAIVLLIYDAFCCALGFFQPELAFHISYLRLYSPFFAFGIVVYDLYARRRPSAAWIAAFAGSFALMVIRAKQEMDRVDHDSFHFGDMPYLYAFLAALGIALIFLAGLIQVHRPRLIATYRVLGLASYPLYAVHQLCGYWIINFFAARVLPGVDIRIPLILFFVVLAAVYGTYLEPVLVRKYSIALKGIRDYFARTPRVRQLEAKVES